MSVHFPNRSIPTTPSYLLETLQEKRRDYYPGLPADFILTGDTWDKPVTYDKRYTLGNFIMLCRHISFTSKVGSLIDSFILGGTSCGKVYLRANFDMINNSSVDIGEFLESRHLFLDGAKCIAETHEELTALFRILFLQNNIPIEIFAKIHGIISEGRCAPSSEPYGPPSDALPIICQPPEKTYPGLPAEFVLEMDDWDHPLRRSTEVCRTIRFVSANDSLMRTFTLVGTWKGKISINVMFRSWDAPEDVLRDLEKFLKSHNLSLDFGNCQARTHQELTNLFLITIKNNRIPPEKLIKINNIVTQGKCEPVPECEPYELPIRVYFGPFPRD